MTGYSTGENNQLLEDGTYRYDYDAEGNRTAKYLDNDSSDDQSSGDTDITEYTWDHRNRLVKVTFRSTYGGAATKVVEYVYDHQDRWVAKLVDPDGDGVGEVLAVTDQYIYDEGSLSPGERAGVRGAPGQIIYVFDGDDRITNRHVWGPLVDQILADEQVHWDTSDYVTDDVLWTLTDHLDTVRDLIDNSANVDNHITYDSYGQVTSETNSNVDTLFLFTARPYDPDTYLQYNTIRWYDLATGTWMSVDPIGHEGGINLYEYVSNNPVGLVDPLGTASAEFSCCGPLDEMILEDNLAAAEKAAKRAAQDAEALYAELLSRTGPAGDIDLGLPSTYDFNDPRLRRLRIEINRWFSTPVGDPNPAGYRYYGSIGWDDLYAVVENLREIADSFRNTIYIECESSCSDEQLVSYRRKGLVTGILGMNSTIHLCPLYWEKQPRKQAGRLLHELSHIYADTEDYGILVASGGGSFAPQYDDGLQLQSSQLVESADTYEGFFESTYAYLWLP